MWIFPNTLQNKLHSNLVAYYLVFMVNFFIRSLQYLYYCNIFGFNGVDLHICFLQEKTET